MIHTIGYAAKSSHSSLKPYEFNRKNPAPDQLLIAIKYCGICHSDIHQTRNEWHNTVYPCMPGHEIIGVVESVGAKVSKFKVGDTVGVGCMIDSCRECENCQAGLEQYCDKGALATYNGNMHEPKAENNTYGGYSNKMVVREDFVLRIPKSLDPAAASPLLCAGITTYSPLRHWKVGPDTKVGIVGLGGLGHIAVKIAVALGADVTVITTSQEKEADAKKLGAKNIVLSTDEKSMEQNAKTLDFILSTIPQAHDVNPYMALLKRDGVLTIVGCLTPLKKPLDMSEMIMNRRSLGSSLIGGIAETQEMLDFCADYKVLPNTKLVSVEQINDCFEKIDKGEVDFRYVIDMASLKGKTEAPGIFESLGLAKSHHEVIGSKDTDSKA